jgi:hypothetical protein
LEKGLGSDQRSTVLSIIEYATPLEFGRLRARDNAGRKSAGYEQGAPGGCSRG